MCFFSFCQERIMRLNMEELFEFFQGSIAQDFGYDDDRVIESLQEAMEELKRTKLDIPPGGDNPPEKPTRAFGIFEPPTIEDLINRMSVPAINSEEDYRAQTLKRNRPSIPPDGGQVFIPSPMMQRLSRLSSSPEESLVGEGSEYPGDESSSRASGLDRHSSETSVADDASDVGSVSGHGDGFGGSIFVPSQSRSSENNSASNSSAANDSTTPGKLPSDYERRLEEALESLELESWELMFKMKSQVSKSDSVTNLNDTIVDNGQSAVASVSPVTNTKAESSSVEVKSNTDAAPVLTLMSSTPLSGENVETSGNVITGGDVIPSDNRTGERIDSQAHVESTSAENAEPAINDRETNERSNKPVIEENVVSVISEAGSAHEEHLETKNEEIVDNENHDSTLLSDETDGLETAKPVIDEDAEIKPDQNGKCTTDGLETTTKSNENVKTKLPVKLRTKVHESKDITRTQENAEKRSLDGADNTDDQENIMTRNRDGVRILTPENRENGSIEGLKSEGREKDRHDPVFLPESPIVQKQRSKLPVSENVRRLIPRVLPKPYKMQNSPSLLPKVPPKPANPMSPKAPTFVHPNDEVIVFPIPHTMSSSPKVETTKQVSKIRPPTLPKKSPVPGKSPVATQLPVLLSSRTTALPAFGDGRRGPANEVTSPFEYAVSGSVFYANSCCPTPATGSDPQNGPMQGARKNSAAGSVPKTSYR